MKTLFLIAAPLLALSGPVLAQPAPARMSVSTAGLDLATPDGVRVLDLRILHAASALCGTPSPADPGGRGKYDVCRDQARHSAAEIRERLLAQARPGTRMAAAAGQ